MPPIDKALQLIKFFEGCHLTAYRFPGESWHTIGWGSTGAWVRAGLTITQAEADARLLEAVERKQALMSQTIRTPLDDNVYQGILSFVYNAREDAYRSSGFLQRLNAGDLPGALGRLLLWEKSERGVEQGLRRRRRAEYVLALTGRVCLDYAVLDDWDAVQGLVSATPTDNPRTLVVTATPGTWLKPRCQQAAVIQAAADPLPENQCHWLSTGALLKTVAHAQQHNHWHITLERPHANRRQWWVYGDHAQWFEEPKPVTIAPAKSAPLATPKPLLRFEMELPPVAKRALVTGTLTIEGAEIRRVLTATSGQPRYQYRGSTHIKGKGCLPSCAELGIPNYWVETQRLERFGTKGIEGYAYMILNYEGTDGVTIRGVRRSEFMIHNDTNRARFPGSSACIVFLFDLGWQYAMDALNYWHKKGVMRVPLIVEY